ncbi:ABC transporter permease [Anaerocolumna xylanovorans]|uniref:Putative ABC transport system permease protein n=1 Tax=Anaerocolumna xylanovorans DSM 12503 TaxID=1121345 RepID=A0A1M7YIL6_9FIRM|nr:ABC transporter permease [Anaerocolumna xylanovorans]SHO52358.1 putative ABC transport system permease protein [Anaerocolumna xylanovorans DSM 12503]
MKLNRRILREIRDNWTKYTGLMLLNIISVMVIVGYSSFAENAIGAVDSFQEKNNLEDGNMVVNKEMDEVLINNIKNLGFDIDATFYIDAKISEGKTLRIFQNREKMDLIEVVKGEGFHQDDDILIDENFAKSNAYEIGDTLVIDNRNMSIAGYGSSPDYIMIVKNITDIVPNHEAFGIAFVSEEGFSKFAPDRVVYSYAYNFRDNSLSEEQQKVLLDKMKELVSKDNYVVDSYKTENNPRINYCKEKLTMNNNIVFLLCSILIVILSYVIAISVISIINEDSANIGTLYAMGYLKKEIVRHYMYLPLVIMSVSSIIGCAIGMSFIRKIVSRTPMSFFNFPIVKSSISARLIVIGIALPVIIVVIVDEILLNKRLSSPVLRLLRKEEKMIGSNNIDLKHFKFMTKFKIRNVMSGMKNYITLFIAILFVVILLLFGLGIKYSLEKYPADVEKSIPYEYSYYLKAPYELKNNGVEKVVDVNCMYNDDYTITLRGIGNDNQFYPLETSDGNKDVYISSAVAEKFGLEEGTEIELKNKSNYDVYHLKIAGIYDYANGLYIFINDKALNGMLGNNPEFFNVLLSDKEVNIPNTYLYASVSKEDEVDASRTIVSMMKSMIVMLIGAAVIISIVTIYLLVKILVDKDKNYISLAKVFGYNNREIRKAYLNSSFLVVVLSVFISIPVSKLMMNVLWLRMTSSIQGYIGFFMKDISYLIIILIILATYLFSHALLNIHTNKIPMNEVLKQRD